MEKTEKVSLIKAWVESANEDFKTVKGLFSLKRYSGCLFFCHLALEKILKALFLKRNNSYPPPAHKLVRLATQSKIKLDEESQKHLAEITTFNIEARYDILKERLYRKATKDYTKKYFEITKMLITNFRELL